MELKEKEFYVEPVLTAHDLLRDITGVTSGGVKTSDKSIDIID